MQVPLCDAPHDQQVHGELLPGEREGGEGWKSRPLYCLIQISRRVPPELHDGD